MGAWKWIALLALLTTAGRVLAETPSHVSEAPPTPGATPAPETQKVLTRHEALVQGLHELHLERRALELVARVFEPFQRMTADEFARRLGEFPPDLLSAEQRRGLVALYTRELSEVRSPTQGLELSQAAKRAVSDQRQRAGGTAMAPAAVPGAFGGVPDALKAQLAELAGKVEKLLDQRQQGAEASKRSALLDLLQSKMAKTTPPGLDSGRAAEPRRRDFPPPAARNAHLDTERRFPERDGLRPPPREGRERGTPPPAPGNNNGNGGNGGDAKGKKEEKKDGQPGQGQTSAFKKNDDPAPPARKKDKDKKDGLKDLLSAAGDKPAAEDGADAAPEAPVEKSIAGPALPSPGAQGAGGFGGGFGFNGGGPTPVTTASGNPPPQFEGNPFAGIGLETYDPPVGAKVQSLPVGYAGGAGAGGASGEETVDGGGAPAASPARGTDRAPVIRQQVFEPVAHPKARAWVMSAVGTLLRRDVCHGVDGDGVGVCQKLRFDERRKLLAR